MTSNCVALNGHFGRIKNFIQMHFRVRQMATVDDPLDKLRSPHEPGHQWRLKKKFMMKHRGIPRQSVIVRVKLGIWKYFQAISVCQTWWASLRPLVTLSSWAAPTRQIP